LVWPACAGFQIRLRKAERTIEGGLGLCQEAPGISKRAAIDLNKKPDFSRIARESCKRRSSFEPVVRRHLRCNLTWHGRINCRRKSPPRFAECRDVFEWLGVQQEQVGDPAGRDATVESEILGRGEGGSVQSICWRARRRRDAPIPNADPRPRQCTPCRRELLIRLASISTVWTALARSSDVDNGDMRDGERRICPGRLKTLHRPRHACCEKRNHSQEQAAYSQCGY
jgi:hypothetical protein